MNLVSQALTAFVGWVVPLGICMDIEMRCVMRSRHGIDYPRLGKYGALAGAALFLLGLVGEFLGHALTQHLPAWENALLTYMLGFGLLLGFVSFFFVFIGGTLVQN